MRKLVHKLFFIIRFSFKNITYHPLRSILLSLGFLGVSLIIFLSFSMKQVMFNYYYAMVEDKYEHIDMTIDVSQTGETRFFSISFLNDQALNQMIDAYYPFFEFDILAESHQETAYVHIFASSSNHLANISGLQSNYPTLNDDEAIITSSYAQKYDLSIGDDITLNASNQSKVFKILDIIDDQGLFTGDSIFIDKDTSLSFFLSSLSPILEDLSPALLRNLYNKVYVDINDGYTYQMVENTMFQLNNYHLTYQETYNLDAISLSATRMTALFDALMVFVLIAIILVLETTLSVYFNDKEKMTGTISILGGKSRFSLSVVIVELLMLSLLTFIIGLIVSQLIIDLGFEYLESSATYQIDGNHMLLALATYVIIFLITFIFHMGYLKKGHDIRLLSANDASKHKHIYSYLIISIMSLLIYVLLFFKSLHMWVKPYQPAIQLIFVFVFVFSLIQILSKLIQKIKFNKKESRLRFLLFKKIFNKKEFYKYLYIITIVFTVCFLLVLNMNHLNKRIDHLEKEANFDLIVSRVIINQEQTFDDISQMDLVEDSTEVGYYLNMMTEIDDKTLSQVISMEGQEINKFFNFNIDSDIIERFTASSNLQIILPNIYREVYLYDVGDSFSMSFENREEMIEFSIAGFYQKESVELAFVNFHVSDELQDLAKQSLMVKSNDKESLLEALIELYGKQMVIITDYQKQVVSPMLGRMHSVINYLTLIMSLMLISFVIALFNHSTLLMTSLASDDAKAMTLGLTKKKLILAFWKNQGLIFSILIIASSIGFFMIYSILEDFLIMFNAYEELILTSSTWYLGFSLNFIIWVFVMIYQSFLIWKIAEIDYIRTY